MNEQRGKKNIRIFLYLLIFIFLIFSVFTWAAERKLEINYPEIFGLKITSETTLPEYVKYIFVFSISIIGFIAFGTLIRAAFTYLTSAGQPAKLQEAKDQITAAFLGVIFLLSSYLILKTINPELIKLNLPPLKHQDIKTVQAPKYEKNEISSISYEIPLGELIEGKGGVWNEEQIKSTKEMIDGFKNFLKQDINVNPKFNSITSLNRYLKSLINECSCSKLTAFCPKPENGLLSSGAGCVGDPCKESRDKINEIISINGQKAEKLLEFRKKIEEQIKIMEESNEKFLYDFERMEKCVKEGGELVTIREYLEKVKYYEEQGWKMDIVTSSSGILSKADSLTFYCVDVGGTVLDTFNKPSGESIDISEDSKILQEMPSELTSAEPLNCPLIIPIGELINKVAYTSLMSTENFKILVSYIDELVKQIRNINNYTSECNTENCQVTCKGIPNPFYQKFCGCIRTCPGTPAWPNFLYYARMCQSPNLQTVGGCYSKNIGSEDKGSPCPTRKIKEAIEEIKNYEDIILKTIEDLDATYFEKPYVVETPDLPINLLNNIKMAVDFCYNEKGNNKHEPKWLMLNCEMALGNLGPNNGVIEACSPADFYCCTANKLELAKVMPLSIGGLSTEIQKQINYPNSQILNYGTSTIVNNCPEGWQCDNIYPSIGYQYENDAAPILQTLITCMKERIKPEDMKKIKITSISDTKLYNPKNNPQCSWDFDAKKLCCSHGHPGNTCGHPSTGLSCHYGGRGCYHQKKSYAVDIGFSGIPWPKNIELGERIKSVAKTCNDRAFPIFGTGGHYNHIHISLGYAGTGCNCR